MEKQENEKRRKERLIYIFSIKKIIMHDTCVLPSIYVLRRFKFENVRENATDLKIV